MYDGRFFMLLETADPATMDKSINPYESDDWGMIGDYVEDYEYEVSDHEYVVFDTEVYYPVMQVNGETPEVHTNIVRDDPRNVNLVKHMTRLAIYELHKLISPTNISNVRINDYNDPIPGESFEYPEFKGYFAGVQWMKLGTTVGTITMKPGTDSEYVGVYQPRDGRDQLLYTFPETGISFMQVIPAVRNKVNTTDLNGPSAQAVWANGKHTGEVTFNFE